MRNNIAHLVSTGKTKIAPRRLSFSTVALTPQDWNQFMLEIQGLSEPFDDPDSLSEEIKAMFQQKI